MKNLFKYAIAAVTALAVVAMLACTPEDVDDPVYTLSVTEAEAGLATVPAGGLDVELHVVANVAWTVEVTPDVAVETPWVTVSPESGNGDTVVTLSVLENAGYAPRTAKVTLSAEGLDPVEVVLTQAGVEVVATTIEDNLAAAVDADGEPVENLVSKGLVYYACDKGLVVGDATAKIFVEVASPEAVAGDEVALVGSVVMSYEKGMVLYDKPAVTVLSSGNTLPTVAALDLSTDNAINAWFGEIMASEMVVVSPEYIKIKGNHEVKAGYYRDPKTYEMATDPVYRTIIKIPGTQSYMSQMPVYAYAGEELLTPYANGGVAAEGWIVAMELNSSYYDSSYNPLMGLATLVVKAEAAEKIVLPPSLTIDGELVQMPAAGGSNYDRYLIVANQGDNDLSVVSSHPLQISATLEEMGGGVGPLNANKATAKPLQVLGGGGDTKTYILAVTATPNESEDPVTATITIACGEAEPVVVTVKQAGKISGTEVVVDFATLFGSTEVKCETNTNYTLATVGTDDEIVINFSKVGTVQGYGENVWYTGWNNSGDTVDGFTLAKDDAWTITSKSGNLTIKYVAVVGDLYSTNELETTTEGSVAWNNRSTYSPYGYEWTWTGNSKSVAMTSPENKSQSLTHIVVIYE